MAEAGGKATRDGKAAQQTVARAPRPSAAITPGLDASVERRRHIGTSSVDDPWSPFVKARAERRILKARLGP